jgi:hypothetical protein
MWFDNVIKRECRNEAFMARHTDGMVMRFQSRVLKFGGFAGKSAGKFDFLGSPGSA